MYSYQDAFDALEYLDSIGVVGGEARQEAVQEIANALGDPDFVERMQYGTWGARQRAKDLDYMRESKKKQELLSQQEFDSIRSMYGSPENPQGK